MSIELKPLPCPHCGSDAVYVDAWEIFRVRCGRCDAMGGGDRERHWAIKKWNKKQTEEAQQRWFASQSPGLDEGGLAGSAQCDGEGQTPNCQEAQRDVAPGWQRTSFMSFWGGPKLELFVIQSAGSSDSWFWTCRGWREPDECHGADSDGWVESFSREACEKAAIAFYMEKDE